MDFKITIKGIRPLLMHNSQLADKGNRFVREMAQINAKKTKRTDADYERLAELEYMGGLYFHPVDGPYMPGINIEQCIKEGARLTREGKLIERGLQILEERCPLVYRGPRELEKLMADENFRHFTMARVQSSRIGRTRPIFDTPWACEASGILDEEQLSWDKFEHVVAAAGKYIGLGDWRPRYGLFDATLTKG